MAACAAGDRVAFGWVVRACCVGCAAVAACALAAPAGAQARSAVAGPYVSLGAGAGFNSSPQAQPSVSLGYVNEHDWHLDAGPSSQASIGWGFDNGVRVEMQADLTANKVSGVSNISVPERAGGLESKYGGFVNLLYDFDIGLPVMPYVGIGAGGLEIEHDDFNRSPPGFVFADPHRGGHQVVGDFAYQGIVGLSYPLDFVPGLSMTAEYRFVGLLDPQPGFTTSRFSSGDPDPTATGTLRFSGDYDQSILLGLRFVLFAPEKRLARDAPLTPSVPVEAAARTYLVFFDWDRADLSTRARQIVAEAASASAHVQTTRIEVNGYTDLSGSAGYNRTLSVRRGESVAAELVRDGVAREEIAVMGYGEANPLVATAKGVREPQNRRVEIILH